MPKLINPKPKGKSKLYLEMKKAGVLECMKGWYCKACIRNYKELKNRYENNNIRAITTR